jgi:hypothetical protein
MTPTVDIGARVDGLRPRLLRRHVLGCAEHAVGHDAELARPLAVDEQLRDPEVENFDEVFARRADQQHVARLEIAVHHAAVVGAAQTGEHLVRDEHRAPRIERAPIELAAQRGARVQLHHEIRHAVVFADVDDAH